MQAQATGVSSERHQYKPKSIEDRWQAAWNESDVFATPKLGEGQKGSYVLPVPPFTSGTAHMGHVRSYTLADAYVRFRRACGDLILFPLGFDSFGLPSELGAIRGNTQPKAWVMACAQKMLGQFGAMGYSMDWKRTFVSSEPDIYRWSQWLFLALRERGWVYQDSAKVDWCEGCKTVLARIQVEDGHCWRCGSPVKLVNRTQWFVRASAYLDENFAMLERLPLWDKLSLGSQHAAMGRVEGVEIETAALDGASLTVFTPHPEQIEGAAFVALSPRHPALDGWILDEAIRARVENLRSGGWQRSEREAEAVTMIDLEHPVTIAGVPRLLPVLVVPSVDSRFGPSAVLGIPELEALDRAIASKLPASKPLRVPGERPAVKPAVRYAAGDFPVSRQRSWGAPIPLIHCPKCGTVPVPVADLPVELPEDLTITGEGNALVDHPTFSKCACPSCGGQARRETDTLDCNFDALWLWMPQCVPSEDRGRELFTHPEMKRWLPTHAVVWGADGGIFITNQRAFTKMLRDQGALDYLPEGEPYVRFVMHEMVRFDGRKMSKHLGNVVDPEALVERLGADTVRFTMLYAAAPRNGINWNEKELEYCHRFIERLWDYTSSRLHGVEVPLGAQIDTSDKLRRQLSKWTATAVKKVTNDLQMVQMHRAARNVIMLLTRIEDFERRALAERGGLQDEDRQALAIALLALVQLAAPLVPHIAEELWSLGGRERFVSVEPWPIEVQEPVHAQ
jgi:leucyl-tRNA synthetase